MFTPLAIALLTGIAIFAFLLKSLLLKSPVRSEAPNCRRAVKRFRVDAKVDLHWEDADGSQRHACASLLDISEDGAQVRCQHPIDPGRPVFLRAHGLNFAAAGQVRYCAGSGPKHSLGVHFKGNTVRFSRGPVDVFVKTAA